MKQINRCAARKRSQRKGKRNACPDAKVMPARLAKLLENPEAIALFKMVNRNLWVYTTEGMAEFFQYPLYGIRQKVTDRLFFDGGQSDFINMRHVKGYDLVGKKKKKLLVRFSCCKVEAKVCGDKRQRVFIQMYMELNG